MANSGGLELGPALSRNMVVFQGSGRFKNVILYLRYGSSSKINQSDVCEDDKVSEIRSAS